MIVDTSALVAVLLDEDGGAILLDTIATAAEPLYGTGNGNGGSLNLLDLMVYAVAKERGEPLLCTGRDFAAADLELHGASRPY